MNQSEKPNEEEKEHFTNDDRLYLNIQISVIDSGIGISEDGLSKLFIDFSKLQENAGRNEQGTGLGLSICKSIIEQMGGSVKAESQLGKGTSFVFNMMTKCIVKKTRFTKKCRQDEQSGNWVFLTKEINNLELNSCLAATDTQLKQQRGQLSLPDQRKLAKDIMTVK